MELYLPTKIYSEKNCVSAHGGALAALGKKAMIVTGKNSARKSGALADVTAALDAQGVAYVLFDRVEENPSVETVMEARAVAVSSGVDFFIGIGGGSPMDAAKAISLLTANPEADEAVLYTPVTLPYLPVACIPTTCGTGSEVTPYAILTRHAQQTKKSISHKIYPSLALLEAKYLASLPQKAVTETAVDALAHLLESYLNANTNELNRIYSREGLTLWSRFRDRLYEGNIQLEDLRNMLHASAIAGMAITHTGTSLPHGMSYPITYALGIPHGRAVGMFLGGFVDHYPDRNAAEEAVAILGFRDTGSFRSYMRSLLGTAEIPFELLNSCAERLLADPSKLKNYPFPIRAGELTSMLN